MFGKLAAKYEANCNPSTVSSGHGDLGGRSYGAIQFASNAGSVDAFVEWLCNSDKEVFASFGKQLSVFEVNSEDFVDKWIEIGDNESEQFLDAQLTYGVAVYYQRAEKNLLDIGIVMSTRGDALKEVVYSRSVQYSAKWIEDMFLGAATICGKEITEMSDEEIIYNLYQFLIDDGEKAYEKSPGFWHSPDDWLNGSRDIIDGLLNRFNREREDALNLLKGIAL